MNPEILTTSQFYSNYYTNFTGCYGLPITLGQQQYITSPSYNSPMDLRLQNHLCPLHPMLLHTHHIDQSSFWDTNSQDSDSPKQPATKRRRLSVESNESITDSVTTTEGISPASFIQQTFAPKLGNLPETSSAVPEMKNSKMLSRILQYNENMVRKFPQKQRSAKEQERRDKNTLACRISRCKEKVKNLAIEEQYKVFTQQNLKFTEETMHKAAYLNELLKYGGDVRPNELNKKIVDLFAKKLNLKFLENIPTNVSNLENRAGGKRPYSMAFLLR